jgi:hypothetical protein
MQDYNFKAKNWAVYRIFEKNDKHKKHNMETLRSSSCDRGINQESWLPSFGSDYVSSSSCITYSDEIEQDSTCTSNPVNKNFN